MNKASLLLTLLLALQLPGMGQDSPAVDPPLGILLLAHGGARGWNDEVSALARTVDSSVPVEVAFGMASKKTIQDAVDRLAKRHVRQIVAVPLFVSSHSSVITSTEYLLGLRSEAPPELAAYAHMTHDHGAHAAGGATGSAGFDPMTPIQSPAPIRMAGALDAHPLVAEMLLSRAKAISQDPARETVVLVAHGPVSDEENSAWLADMGVLATAMKRTSNFGRVEYLTVRDDAPEPIRSQATADFRAIVERGLKRGDKVLIVPLLISYGGIEAGIRKRLEGLTYTISSQALLPDERMSRWVLQAAQSK